MLLPWTSSVPLLCWTMATLVSTPQLAPAADSSTTTRVQFSQEDVKSCPTGDLSTYLTNGSIRQLMGVQDRRTCIVECALWQACVAVFFSAATGLCQLGTLSAWLQRWQASGTTASDCVSHVRPPPLPDNLQAKLLMFYNFRFGLANQVNSNTFRVTPSNAQRTKNGLELRGDFTSKAEIDLMGSTLKRYLNSKQEITFFVKVSTTNDYLNPCFHQSYNKTLGTDGISGKWCRGNLNKVTFLARDLTPSTFTSADNFLPSDPINATTFSTAVSYSSVTTTTFYYNTALYTAADATADNGPLGDNGLFLGYDITAPFKGFFHCYGIATAVLNQTEIAQLHSLC